MESTMTFGQFVNMCEHYEHSKEYYDVMKESMELDLMSMYLENQRFLREDAMDYSFTEGYLVEATSEEQTDTVKTAFKDKGKNLLKKIWNQIKKILNVLANFVKKIFSAEAKLEDKRKADIEFINGKLSTMTEADFEAAVIKSKIFSENELGDLTNERFGNDGPGKIASSRFAVDVFNKIFEKALPPTDDMKLNKRAAAANDVNTTFINRSCKYFVQAALTSENISVISTNKNVPSFEYLLICFNSLLEASKNAKEQDPEDMGYENVNKHITNTITVSVDPESFKKHLKLLKMLPYVDITFDDKDFEDYRMNAYSFYTEQVAMLHRYTAGYIAIYNKVYTFRKTFIESLYRIAVAANKVTK